MENGHHVSGLIFKIWMNYSYIHASIIFALCYRYHWLLYLQESLGQCRLNELSNNNHMYVTNTVILLCIWLIHVHVFSNDAGIR